VDNDCDGEVDEELGTTTCGLGVCEHTVDNCIGGIPQICNPLEGLSPEDCDGLDNNCDGLVDELFVDTDGDGDADCIDPDDDDDGDPDDDDCAPLDPAVNHGADEVCHNGVDDNCADGVDEGCAVLSCNELVGNPGVESGVFVLDVDGQGGEEHFNAYCEMELDGGGWTLVATLSNVDNTLNWSMTGTIFSAWKDADSLVKDDPDLVSDYKSMAYSKLKGSELAVKTSEGVWGVWTGLNDKTLLQRLMDEVPGGCNSWGDGAATLPVKSASVASLNRNMIINAVDGNWGGHCSLTPPGDGASDAAILAFAGTSEEAVGTGAGLKGIGQSWETNIKGTYPPAIQCNNLDCYEDFVTGKGWLQSGSKDHFFTTPFNNNDESLDPERIWIFVR